MRKILLRSIVGGSLLLLFSATASPQYPPRVGDPYHDQDRGGRGQFFETIRADLDRAESTASLTGDVDRIDRAREMVSLFARKMDDGNYDPRDMNELIVSVQRVLDNNRLYDRTRDALTDDLNRLRDMRAHYDGR